RPWLAALSFAVIAVTLPLLVIRWFPALRRYSADNSSRQLARLILESPDRGLPVYGFYYFRTGLPFYLRRPVGLISTDGGQLTSNYVASRYRRLLEQNPSIASEQKTPRGAPTGESNFPLLMTGQDLFNLSRSPGSPFLLLLRNDEINLALETAGSMQPLWQAWEYSVWKKEPGLRAGTR
ncbi:MAG: hypothetical protein KGM47_00655, partial [Acidobacteriota bacterium]|nr:hypothetical protein [Acidobacteriota bacterium]